MPTALLLAAVLATDPLVPEVSEPPVLEAVLRGPVEPTAGMTALKWGYTLGTFGTTAALACAITMAIFARPSPPCTADEYCNNEGAGLGMGIVSIPLALGLFIGSFAIPLITGGWGVRNDS